MGEDVRKNTKQTAATLKSINDLLSTQSAMYARLTFASLALEASDGLAHVKNVIHVLICFFNQTTETA